MAISNLKIETERLVIRPFEENDYENWYQQLNNRMPAQYKYDDGKPKNISKYTKNRFIKMIHENREKAKHDIMYHFGIFRKKDDVNLGKIEIWTILRMDYQWGMMGYSIHNQFWKNGYGIESVAATTLASFSKFHFHRIELHIRPDNEPSIRLAKRVGFQLECVRKAFSLENDQWTDYLIYYQNSDEASRNQ